MGRKSAESCFSAHGKEELLIDASFGVELIKNSQFPPSTTQTGHS